MSQHCIILGSNHHNTYGVIRSLYAANIKADVFVVSKDSKCFYKQSRYLSSITFVKDINALLNALMNNECSPHTPLIACTDKLAAFVNEHSEFLKQKYIVPGCKEQGYLRTLMNKNRMAEMAIECDLTVPKSAILSKPFNIDSIDIKYPVIIKPINSIIGEKSDVCICNDQADVLAYLKNSNQEQVIIQQYINKEYEFQIIGVSLDYGRIIIIPTITYLMRASSDNTNTGTVYVDDMTKSSVDLLPIKTFIKATGYQGLFSVEFLHSADGTDFFMEMNFRNDGNTISNFASGINLPKIWCLQDSNADKHSQIIPQITVPLFPMIKRTAKRPKEIFKFLSELFRQRCLMDISLTDPQPFLYKIFRI